MSLPFTKSNRRPGVNDTAKIRQVFTAFDENKDGVLSREEVTAMLDKMGIKMSKEHCKQFFDVIDDDRSGKIEFGEFLDWYTTLMDLADAEAQATMTSLQNTTSFTRSELETIYANYKRVSASITDDGTIDYNEFKQMMMSGGVSSWNTFLVDGLFRLFDVDKSGNISFEEFVSILSIYHNKHKKSVDEKHKLMFSLYDVDSDNKISKQDLCKILNDCLCCNNMFLPEEDVARLVDATFARNGCGAAGMNFDAYKKEVGARRLE